MERKYNLNNLMNQIKNLKYEDYILYINDKEWFDMKNYVETYFTPQEQMEFRKLKKENPILANTMTAGFIVRVYQDLNKKMTPVGGVVVNLKNKEGLVIDLSNSQNIDYKSTI